MTESSNKHSPDVYVHVPKTAGTSLRDAVIQHYGANAVWAYDLSSGLLFRADKQMYRPEDPKHIALRSLIARLPSPLVNGALRARRLLASSPEKAFEKSTAIIGHFTVDAFDHIPIAQSAPRFTVVREPLSRMISHYRYLQQSRNFAPNLRSWMAKDDPNMPFADFALSTNVQNFQTRYTGTDPNRFAYVGTTEKMSDFMIRLGLIDSKTDMPRINQTTAAPLDDKFVSDPGFLHEFEQFHGADYEFYTKVAAE